MHPDADWTDRCNAGNHASHCSGTSRQADKEW
jgi:hypothetical protein